MQPCLGCRQLVGRHTVQQLARCNQSIRAGQRRAAAVLVGAVNAPGPIPGWLT